jgi:hypothetical protein
MPGVISSFGNTGLAVRRKSLSPPVFRSVASLTLQREVDVTLVDIVLEFYSQTAVERVRHEVSPAHLPKVVEV